MRRAVAAGAWLAIGTDMLDVAAQTASTNGLRYVRRARRQYIYHPG